MGKMKKRKVLNIIFMYREDKKSALRVFIVVAISEFAVGICFPVFVGVYLLTLSYSCHRNSGS